MSQIGPEDFERFRDRGPVNDGLAEEDAIARFHYQETGRKILYGPVDKLVPESQALLELALMQIRDLSHEEEVALDPFRPTVFGRIFVPENTAILNERGIYSNVKVSGTIEVPLPSANQKKTAEVEVCYLFAGAVRRMRDRVFGSEPSTCVRTRIFEA